MESLRNPKVHDATVVDQFTRQAEPFAQRHGYSKDALLELMAECAAVKPTDAVLDVACGPGIISCFFAKRASHVTGLDFVPAMLERARRYQDEQQAANVTWQLGSSTDLPFKDGTFDCAVTRFSFHHFLDPQTATREMKRVVKPGGMVVVCDVAPRPEVQEQFNHWEILRDPSHVRALTEVEQLRLGENVGLQLRRREKYDLQMSLDDLLGGSFPNPGDEERIRMLFDEEIAAGTDKLGVSARREGGAVHITYPVVVQAWQKPL